ncbi:hypothetical protein MNBD_GAMMA03-1550 [hydrothermal vent metagenome]|uniref:Uncharacterized protein n=1 Tax=hydrothermal vent metagenome TaxID=652676 RepID=A0A3B0WAQ1_9ZZZZ
MKFLKISRVFVLLMMVALSLQLASLVYAGGNGTVPITLELQDVKNGNFGSHQKYIHQVSIGLLDKTLAETQYLILYFCDDQFIKEYKNQTLPYSFLINLAGKTVGTHEIRIDIEDGNDNVLASETISVNVVR